MVTSPAEYTLNPLPSWAALNALPRKEARVRFNEFVASRAERVAQLRAVVEADGVVWGGDDAAVQALNDWFVARVEPGPSAGVLSPRAESLARDVGTYLGEVMIERHPQLSWEFFTWGKSAVMFQCPVLMGLSTEDPKFHTNVDVIRMTVQYAHQVLEAAGSVPDYGTVEVGGVSVDVEATAARFRAQGFETGEFVQMLARTAERA